MNNTNIPLEKLYSAFLASNNICIDSRKLQKGDLFFALKGDLVDGNKYALAAIKKGASYAVVSDKTLAQEPQCIFVQDTLIALQQLANFHRRKFRFPFIAITGSNGKTTTKELLASVMKTEYNVHFTQGNFNNHIGVPLTLLQLKKEHQVAIIEMGANKPGDIKELCEIAEPSHGVITNIGKAHLEGFGDLEGVKQTKSELYRYLNQNNGIAFINVDENYLTDLAKNVRSIFYQQTDSISPERNISEVELHHFFPFIECTFSLEDVFFKLKSHLFGAHNFENIKTAICLGKYFKVPGSKIVTGIENYIPDNNRSELVKWKEHLVILDAYNANPSSMKSALTSFNKLVDNRPKILILGDMLELGKYSDTEHQEIVDYTKQLNISKVILVGREFHKTITLAQKFLTVQELKESWKNNSFQPSCILIKGSRGIQLETFID